MYLKALELQGFKSFPDKTVLTFGEEITAIVGPNGSGKSNLSDAVRWVMGEQSTRTLRGGKMEDVIFGGTAHRRQTGYAEVSLVLDNADRRLEMEESEVMLTRRYYRSGESEYYINRRAVRLKDVNELLMDTGLGREGYSIIGQGRIDEILSLRSTDRREIFEEAAGISRFRHRKEEAQRKLERTQENLVRIHDKIAELELQVAPLRQQSETARTFLRLRDELRGLEISVWLDTLEHIRTGKIKLEGDCLGAQEQKNQAERQVEAAFARAEQLTQAMREKELEVDRLRQEIQGQDVAAGELEAAMAVLRSTMDHHREAIQRIRGELEQREGRQSALSAQLEQGRRRLEELERRLAEGRTRVQVQQAQVDRTIQSAGALSRELEQLRDRESRNTADAGEARALRSALETADREVSARREEVRREQENLEGRRKQAEGQTRAGEQALNRAREERDGLQNQLAGYTLRLEGRQKREEQARAQHRQLHLEGQELAARVKLLTELEKVHEGYSRAVKLVLEEAERGRLHHVHGAVAGLLQVPDPYTVAIETALGGAMQHLVVDREEDGKAILQFLKRRDGGRATILPLSSIRPGQLRQAQEIAREPGVVGIASRLIRFEERYGPVFSNLLDRVVVAQELDSAIALARKYQYQFRIVTLDGQVLNPGGSMTGGSASRSGGILSRANELERLREALARTEERCTQAAQALEEAARATGAAQYQRDTAQEQLRHWEDQVLTAQGHLALCQQEQRELESQEEGLVRELEGLSTRRGEIAARLQAVQERLEVLEGQSIRFQEETRDRLAGQSRLQDTVQALNQELTRLTAAQAALEAERDTTARSLSELEALGRELEGDRAGGLALIAQYEEKNRAIVTKIGEKQEALAQLHRQREGCQQAIQDRNQEKLALEGERTRATREGQEKNKEVLHLSGEVARLEQKKLAASLEEKQLLDRLWENYELSHEAAKAQRVDIESVPRAGRRIAELKQQIGALGAVNIGAIQEFERVNERYTYLTDQRDDVEGARAELESVIGQITREMKAIFQREFTRINGSFAQTFRELFGGGSAALELEDPEDILNCGIEIKVQPPGKALKTITLLSGGEKAFVAIALYFAILKVRPTPFVVMDEIEAALDDNNVVRFADYMRSMAQTTQFIVITHRRGTMEEADVLYGVTMQEQGVSRMLTINLNQAEREFVLT